MGESFGMSAEACLSSDSNLWMTPPDMLAPVIELLGGIDLDPCSNVGIPNIPAEAHFTEADDGLSRPWFGRVYCNPPYRTEAPKWTAKAIAEVEAGRAEAVILLIASRTGSAWFVPLFTYPICFKAGRVRFLNPDGTRPKNGATFDSAIVYVRKEYRADDLREFSRIFGRFGPIVMGAL